VLLNKDADRTISHSPLAVIHVMLIIRVSVRVIVG